MSDSDHATSKHAGDSRRCKACGRQVAPDAGLHDYEAYAEFPEPCSYCGEMVRRGCSWGCENCDAAICRSCKSQAAECDKCGSHLCPTCADDDLACRRCGGGVCRFCAYICCLCGRVQCVDCFEKTGGFMNPAAPVCGRCIRKGATVSGTIPLEAFLAADGVSPDEKARCWQDLVRADVIVTEDVAAYEREKSRPICMYGRDAARAIASGVKQRCRVLVVGLDYSTDDIHRLAALIEKARGRSDFQSSDDPARANAAGNKRGLLPGHLPPNMHTFSTINQIASELRRRAGSRETDAVFNDYATRPSPPRVQAKALFASDGSPNQGSEALENLCESEVILFQDTASPWLGFVHGQTYRAAVLAGKPVASAKVLIVEVEFGSEDLLRLLGLLMSQRGFDDLCPSLLSAIGGN